MSVLNILYVTYIVTSSLAVFEAAIRVKSTHLIKIMFENQIKKRENMGIKSYFYINLHLKNRLDIECTACYGELMPEEALTFTTSDVVTHGISNTNE